MLVTTSSSASAQGQAVLTTSPTHVTPAHLLVEKSNNSTTKDTTANGRENIWTIADLEGRATTVKIATVGAQLGFELSTNSDLVL
jgi:ABC-type amino acid transport substrate-binding protein